MTIDGRTKPYEERPFRVKLIAINNDNSLKVNFIFVSKGTLMAGALCGEGASGHVHANRGKTFNLKNEFSLSSGMRKRVKVFFSFFSITLLVAIQQRSSMVEKSDDDDGGGQQQFMASACARNYEYVLVHAHTHVSIDDVSHTRDIFLSFCIRFGTGDWSVRPTHSRGYICIRYYGTRNNGASVWRHTSLREEERRDTECATCKWLVSAHKIWKMFTTSRFMAFKKTSKVSLSLWKIVICCLVALLHFILFPSFIQWA